MFRARRPANRLPPFRGTHSFARPGSARPAAHADKLNPRGRALRTARAAIARGVLQRPCVFRELVTYGDVSSETQRRYQMGSARRVLAALCPAGPGPGGSQEEGRSAAEKVLVFPWSFFPRRTGTCLDRLPRASAGGMDVSTDTCVGRQGPGRRWTGRTARSPAQVLWGADRSPGAERHPSAHASCTDEARAASQTAHVRGCPAENFQCVVLWAESCPCIPRRNPDPRST